MISGLCNGDGPSFQQITLYMLECFYDPASLEIDVGDEVEWIIAQTGFSSDVNGNLNSLTESVF